MIRSCDVLDKIVGSLNSKNKLVRFSNGLNQRMRSCVYTGVRAILNIDSVKYLKNDQNRTRETNMATQR